MYNQQNQNGNISPAMIQQGALLEQQLNSMGMTGEQAVRMLMQRGSIPKDVWEKSRNEANRLLGVNKVY